MRPLFGDMFDQARLKKAGDAMMQGLRDMHETTTASTKARTDEVVDFWTAFFSVKSMEDVQKLQTHVAQSMEKSAGDTQKASASFKSLVENTMKALGPGDGAKPAE